MARRWRNSPSLVRYVCSNSHSRIRKEGFPGAVGAATLTGSPLAVEARDLAIYVLLQQIAHVQGQHNQVGSEIAELCGELQIRKNRRVAADTGVQNLYATTVHGSQSSRE